MGQQAEGAIRQLEGVRVLVVDDEEDVAEVIATIVTSHGAYAEWTSTVADARARLRNARFDVVLTDVCMPGESGYDLLRSVRSGDVADSALAVAAITARQEPRDWQELQAAGFDRVLAKPFGIALLVSSVAELARLRPG